MKGWLDSENQIDRLLLMLPPDGMVFGEEEQKQVLGRGCGTS
jgi:hypothetical protein